jgi:hypothetical protein
MRFVAAEGKTFADRSKNTNVQVQLLPVTAKLSRATSNIKNLSRPRWSAGETAGGSGALRRNYEELFS